MSWIILHFKSCDYVKAEYYSGQNIARKQNYMYAYLINDFAIVSPMLNNNHLEQFNPCVKLVFLV